MENQYNSQVDYAQAHIVNDIQIKSVEKINEFKQRLSEFNNVSTLEEAKNLAKKIMPVSQEINRFNIGGAKCTVINKPDMLRISIDSTEEFISYDFT